MCDLQHMLADVCPLKYDIPPLNKGYRAWPFELFPNGKQHYEGLQASYFTTKPGNELNAMTWNTAALWCAANSGHIAQFLTLDEVTNISELVVSNMIDNEGKLAVRGFE